MGNTIKKIILPLVCTLLSLPLAYANGNETRTKEDLETIQKELKVNAERLAAQKTQISQLEINLKNSEFEIAQNAKSLKELLFSTEFNPYTNEPWYISVLYFFF